MGSTPRRGHEPSSGPHRLTALLLAQHGLGCHAFRSIDLETVGFVRHRSAVCSLDLFYTEEDSLIPVPDRYQHLFPEAYPDAIKTAPRP